MSLHVMSSVRNIPGVGAAEIASFTHHSDRELVVSPPYGGDRIEYSI